MNALNVTPSKIGSAEVGVDFTGTIVSISSMSTERTGQLALEIVKVLHRAGVTCADARKVLNAAQVIVEASPVGGP